MTYSCTILEVFVPFTGDFNISELLVTLMWHVSTCTSCGQYGVNCVHECQYLRCQCCLTIINLVYILRPSLISAGQKIPGVYARPVTRAQKLENLQLCMSFMGNRNVNLQGIYVGGEKYNY